MRIVPKKKRENKWKYVIGDLLKLILMQMRLIIEVIGGKDCSDTDLKEKIYPIGNNCSLKTPPAGSVCHLNAVNCLSY